MDNGTHTHTHQLCDQATLPSLLIPPSYLSHNTTEVLGPHRGCSLVTLSTEHSVEEWSATDCNKTGS